MLLPETEGRVKDSADESQYGKLVLLQVIVGENQDKVKVCRHTCTLGNTLGSREKFIVSCVLGSLNLNFDDAGV